MWISGDIRWPRIRYREGRDETGPDERIIVVSTGTLTPQHWVVVSVSVPVPPSPEIELP